MRCGSLCEAMEAASSFFSGVSVISLRVLVSGKLTNSFDEVHFGGFAAKYIKRKFFMDVHPPLAKMLITLSAFVGGFDGRFDFKDIGKCVSLCSDLGSLDCAMADLE